MIRILLNVAIWPLPWKLRRLLLVHLFGYRISPSAFIGYSIVIARTVELGPRSRIGHLTFVRELEELILAEGSRLGNLNWVTGYLSLPHETRRSALRLREHSAITHRHLIDCTDQINIGRFSTIAGWHSQFVSHAIDLPTSKQTSQSITVGNYCFVGSRCLLLKGASLPDYSVLGAGSSLTKAQPASYSLYAGSPARYIKPLSKDFAYFKRQTGFVS